MRELDVNRRLLLFAARTVAEARRLSHPRELGPALLRGARALVRLPALALRMVVWVPAWFVRRLAAAVARAYRGIDFDGFRRSALLACALAGGVLLIVADFSTVRKVTVLTVARDHIRGGPEHLYALAVLGALAIPLAWGAAAGRSRPAMRGLVVIGLIALAVALAVDLRQLGDTEGLGRLYDDVGGSAAIGFAREVGGAVLLMVSGMGLLLLTPRARRRSRHAGRGEIAVEPSPTAPAT